jgi:phospholipase C
MSTATNTLLPWYLGYQGGDSNEAIQCMAAGDNGYQDNQAALNHGLNNHWARNNTPWSWGYFKREDIPVQFAIAEGWTSGDMYQVRLHHRCVLEEHTQAMRANQRTGVANNFD